MNKKRKVEKDLYKNNAKALKIAMRKKMLMCPIKNILMLAAKAWYTLMHWHSVRMTTF